MYMICPRLMCHVLSATASETASQVVGSEGGRGHGELRPWHYIYVCSTESRLIMGVRYDSHIRIQIASNGNPKQEFTEQKVEEGRKAVQLVFLPVSVLQVEPEIAQYSKST